MPNKSFEFDQFNHEMRDILNDTLLLYSRDLNQSLLAKRASSNILSELEKKQLTLCSEIQLGQIVFTKHKEFLTLLKALARQEISVGLFEWRFLHELRQARYTALENEKQFIVLKVNALLMPTFYDRILQVEQYCSITDFNEAQLDNRQFNTPKNFMRLQNESNSELNLKFIDAVSEIHDCLFLLLLRKSDV